MYMYMGGASGMGSMELRRSPLWVRWSYSIICCCSVTVLGEATEGE